VATCTEFKLQQCQHLLKIAVLRLCDNAFKFKLLFGFRSLDRDRVTLYDARDNLAPRNTPWAGLGLASYGMADIAHRFVVDSGYLAGISYRANCGAVIFCIDLLFMLGCGGREAEQRRRAERVCVGPAWVPFSLKPCGGGMSCALRQCAWWQQQQPACPTAGRTGPDSRLAIELLCACLVRKRAAMEWRASLAGAPFHARCRPSRLLRGPAGSWTGCAPAGGIPSPTHTTRHSPSPVKFLVDLNGLNHCLFHVAGGRHRG
jgi:hypothetical protein